MPKYCSSIEDNSSDDYSHQRKCNHCSRQHFRCFKITNHCERHERHEKREKRERCNCNKCCHKHQDENESSCKEGKVILITIR